MTTHGMRRPTIDEIIDTVCAVIPCDRDTLFGGSRSKAATAGRALATYMMRRYRNMSYPECAEALRRHNHSGIIGTSKTIRLRGTDRPLHAILRNNGSAGPHLTMTFDDAIRASEAILLARIAHKDMAHNGI